MVEEQLAKGNLRWLANFNEIHKNYQIGEATFPIYATGSLQERGFFLSRIFSTLVTPKYKVHFLLYTATEFDPKLLRKIILSCKSRFESADWVFLSLVQTQPLDRETKNAAKSIEEKSIGVAIYSLGSKELVSSENVLGRALTKQLKLTEAKFEAFDLPNYVKSFTIVFSLGIVMLIFIALSGLRQAIQPLTLLLMAVFSLIAGHRIYKTRYHTTFSLDGKGFQLKQGSKTTEGEWSDYSEVSFYVTPSHETCIRLHSKDKKIDLPLSRVGLSRKEAYDAIKQLVKKN
jgi:hypothetical protein